MGLSAMRICRTDRCRRGFTLTELAIVLGVSAVVIAAIWVAKSSASSRATANQAIDEVNGIVTNARAFYAGQNASYTALTNQHTLSAAPSSQDFCYYTALFIKGNIFPPDMVNTGGIANDPWIQGSSDCGGAVGTAQVALAGTASPAQLVVRFEKVPTQVCVNLVMANATTGTDTNLTQIIVTGAASSTTLALPITPATAATACAVTGPFTFDWYYNVGG